MVMNTLRKAKGESAGLRPTGSQGSWLRMLKGEAKTA